MLKSPVRHQRLHGYLNLRAEGEAGGPTRFVRKGFKAPIHISKPYWNGHSLLLNVMSPTAGLLEGDRIDIDVTATNESSLTLSNPAALRIHKMTDGDAKLEQRYHVDSSSFLELNPEWLIPQAESSFRQTTNLTVDPGGELLFIEAIAPGRVAHGESFAFKKFSNRLKLKYGDTLAALEHFSLSSNASIRPWKSSLESAFFVSIFLVSKKLEASNEIWKHIHALHANDLTIGSSQLAHPACWNVKMLTANPVTARKTIESIRRLFYSAIERPYSNLRRQ